MATTPQSRDRRSLSISASLPLHKSVSKKTLDYVKYIKLELEQKYASQEFHRKEDDSLTPQEIREIFVSYTNLPPSFETFTDEQVLSFYEEWYQKTEKELKERMPEF